MIKNIDSKFQFLARSLTLYEMLFALVQLI